jgi:hypothetical protein
MQSRPRIRQLGLGELLDESFGLYRNNFLTFVAIAALVLVPYTLFSFAAQYPLQERLMGVQSGSNPFITQSPFEMIGELLFWYLLIFAVSMMYVVVFQPLMEGALAHGITQRYLGRDTGVGDSFGAALRRAPSLILARLIPLALSLLLAGVIFGGGALLLLLLIGQSFSDLGSSGFGALFGFEILGFGLMAVLILVGIGLVVRIMFTSQTIVVENAGPWQSIVRSWRLTEDSFWRLVGYLLVIGLMIYFLVALPTFVVSFASTLLGIDIQLQMLINTCANAVLSVIVTPFSMIAYTLLYFDLRVRNEGFDLEYQANTLLPSMGMSAFESR